MRDGPRCFTLDSSCPALLRVPPVPWEPARKGLSPAAARLSRRFRFVPLHSWRPYNPGRAFRRPRFGLRRFRSPLLAVSLLFSLPPGTWMFRFPGFAPASPAGAMPSAWRVAPFGHPRISGHLRLPAAFRSLSRPSSPPEAKASAVRPCPLLVFRGRASATMNMWLRRLRSFSRLSLQILESLSGRPPACRTDVRHTGPPPFTRDASRRPLLCSMSMTSFPSSCGE